MTLFQLHKLTDEEGVVTYLKLSLLHSREDSDENHDKRRSE